MNVTLEMVFVVTCVRTPKEVTTVVVPLRFTWIQQIRGDVKVSHANTFNNKDFVTLSLFSHLGCFIMQSHLSLSVMTFAILFSSSVSPVLHRLHHHHHRHYYHHRLPPA